MKNMSPIEKEMYEMDQAMRRNDRWARRMFYFMGILLAGSIVGLMVVILYLVNHHA